jgi:hypothetical protein
MNDLTALFVFFAFLLGVIWAAAWWLGRRGGQ